MKTKYFECSCTDAEHVIRIVFDQKEKELWFELQLSQHNNIFKRIWKAIKYVFGYRCKYGHWECTSMMAPEVKDLRDELTKFLRKIR